MALRTFQGQLAMTHNIKKMPKIDTKLIDSESEDLPPSKSDCGEKKGEEKPPSASIEP